MQFGEFIEPTNPNERVSASERFDIDHMITFLTHQKELIKPNQEISNQLTEIINILNEFTDKFIGRADRQKIEVDPKMQAIFDDMAGGFNEENEKEISAIREDLTYMVELFGNYSQSKSADSKTKPYYSEIIKKIEFLLNL